MSVCCIGGVLGRGRMVVCGYVFFFSSRRRHTRFDCDWSSDVCSSDLASLGFLWYNSHPADVFMGDVGALPLGGALAAVAVMTKQEMLLAIVGGVFVLEALSVIVQVASFQTTGKRVFRMAPLHHHFELAGWPESRVIVRFWILSILFAVLGLSTLKLR